MEKLKEVFGSIRFWYAIGLGLTIYLESVGVFDNGIATALKTFFTAGITVRTASEIAKAIAA